MPSLTLRPFSAPDAAAILDAERDRHADWAEDYPSAPDTEIAEHLQAGVFASPTTTEPWGPWILLADGVVVGGCGFHGPPIDGVAEVGYNVVPSRQGQGLATSAVGLLIDLARSAGLTMLVAGTDPANLASQRVLQHHGFVATDPAGGELRWALPLAGLSA